MLQEHHWSLKIVIDLLTKGCNSVKTQNVAIFRGDLVSFEAKAIFFHDLRDVVVPVIEAIVLLAELWCLTLVRELDQWLVSHCVILFEKEFLAANPGGHGKKYCHQGIT